MRAQSSKSPAVRFFTIHRFDDRPDIRAATMRLLLDHLAAGRISPLIYDRLPLGTHSSRTPIISIPIFSPWA
jgi:hypothetical protein